MTAMKNVNPAQINSITLILIMNAELAILHNFKIKFKVKVVMKINLMIASHAILQNIGLYLNFTVSVMNTILSKIIMKNASPVIILGFIFTFNFI